MHIVRIRDFNQMLGLPLGQGHRPHTHLSQLDVDALEGLPIRVADHTATVALPGRAAAAAARSESDRISFSETLRMLAPGTFGIAFCWGVLQ